MDILRGLTLVTALLGTVLYLWVYRLHTKLRPYAVVALSWFIHIGIFYSFFYLKLVSNYILNLWSTVIRLQAAILLVITAWSILTMMRRVRDIKNGRG